MTLYEINKAILDCIDDETGEVKENELEALQMQRDQKIENVALWIKNLNSDVSALKAEKEAIEARCRGKENKLKSLKNYLKYALDGQKFETAKCAVSYTKSQAVDIVNMREIPQEYLRFKPVEADKTAIRKALREGEEVAGARLVERVSVIIK